MRHARFIDTRKGQKVTLALMGVGLVLSALAGAWLGEHHPEVSGGQSHRETLPLCSESAERPCYDDFDDQVQFDYTMVPIGSTIYEDGSWVSLDGASGCLEGGLCNDDAPMCEDEYESTDCYYIQGEQTWYVDSHGEAHEVTK